MMMRLTLICLAGLMLVWQLRTAEAIYGLTTPGTSTNPAASCLHIKTINASAPSGFYWIKPVSFYGAAFNAFCDMTTDGGGWMLVSNQAPYNGTRFSQVIPQTTGFGPSSTSTRYIQSIIDSTCSLSTSGFFQVMVEETSASSPDKIAGLVMSYRLPTSVSLAFDFNNTSNFSPRYVFSVANTNVDWLTPNGYVTVVDNARGSASWWGLSVHDTAFSGLASSLRCVLKNNFTNPATGATNGDYKLDHDPITSAGHTGTTRCLHIITTYGVSHWIRPLGIDFPNSCQARVLQDPNAAAAQQVTIDVDGVNGFIQPVNTQCEAATTFDNAQLRAWTKVFQQYAGINASASWWAGELTLIQNSTYNAYSSVSTKYSILNLVENMKGTTGAWAFSMRWPAISASAVNIWGQNSNFVWSAMNTSSYIGYSIYDSTQNWFGLEYNSVGGPSLADGSVNIGNWWYALASTADYNSPGPNTIPGPGTTTSRVELWLRVRCLNSTISISSATLVGTSLQVVISASLYFDAVSLSLNGATNSNCTYSSSSPFWRFSSSVSTVDPCPVTYTLTLPTSQAAGCNVGFVNNVLSGGVLNNVASGTITASSFEFVGANPVVRQSRTTVLPFQVFSNATCMNMTLQYPSLWLNQSSINSTSLNLFFASTSSFASARFVFIGNPVAACNSDANVFWSRSLSSSTCFTYYWATIPINFALTNCSFVRDESVAGTTVFSATLEAITDEIQGTIRGVLVNKTQETAVTVQVAYVTFLNASTNPLNISGSIITESAISSQTFNPITFVATLTLLTAVQSPYQLALPVITQVSGFVATISPQSAEPTNSTIAVCSSGNTSPCVQTWVVTLLRTTNCNPPPTTLNNSGWTVSYTVGCHASYTGVCSAPSPSSVQVQFDTSSGDYCPRLVSLVTSSASLGTFSNNATTVTQGSFVFGTRTFFSATVTSLINIDNVRAETIRITAGAPAGVDTLYSAPYTNASHYFAQLPVASSFTAQPAGFTGNFDASPSLMLVYDNLAGANAFQRSVLFSWVWSGATSSAIGDASTVITVQVNLRVRYSNQTTVSLPVNLELKQPINQRARVQATGALTAAGSVTVRAAGPMVNGGGGGDVSPTATTSGSASGMASMTVMIAVACGVGAALAVLVVAVVMMHRRRAKVPSLHKSSSVESTDNIVERDSSVEMSTESI